MTEDIARIITCERMKGWDIQTYEAQPEWFLGQLLTKWSLDAEKEEQEAKKAKRKN